MKSWDPNEAELRSCRYLNYATNTVVKSAKLVPTLIISVGSLGEGLLAPTREVGRGFGPVENNGIC